MAKINEDGVTVQIKDIVSYYLECDDINDPNDIGTYEGFIFNLNINGKSIFYGVKNDKFELCSGNILSLIEMMKKALESNEYQEIEFLEPNFLFECRPDSSTNTYQFSVWVNSGCWESAYSSTNVGCRFELEEEELKKFLEDLIQEWEQRKKQKY